jgi:hypothetical protein
MRSATVEQMTSGGHGYGKFVGPSRLFAAAEHPGPMRSMRWDLFSVIRAAAVLRCRPAACGPGGNLPESDGHSESCLPSCETLSGPGCVAKINTP